MPGLGNAAQVAAGSARPLRIRTVAPTFDRLRRSVVGCEAYLPEQPAQVDDHLRINVLGMRRLEDLGFPTQRLAT